MARTPVRTPSDRFSLLASLQNRGSEQIKFIHRVRGLRTERSLDPLQAVLPKTAGQTSGVTARACRRVRVGGGVPRRTGETGATIGSKLKGGGGREEHFITGSNSHYSTQRNSSGFSQKS